MCILAAGWVAEGDKSMVSTGPSVFQLIGVFFCSFPGCFKYTLATQVGRDQDRTSQSPNQLDDIYVCIECAIKNQRPANCGCSGKNVLRRIVNGTTLEIINLTHDMRCSREGSYEYGVATEAAIQGKPSIYCETDIANRRKYVSQPETIKNRNTLDMRTCS